MLPTDDQTETTTTDPLDGDGFGQFRLKTTDGHRVTSRLRLCSDSEGERENPETLTRMSSSLTKS